MPTPRTAAILAIACMLRPQPALAAAAASPTTVDYDPTSVAAPLDDVARLRMIEARVRELDRQAHEAADAGDLHRASELWLDAERRIPALRLRARASRILQALQALQALRARVDAAQNPSRALDRAEAAASGLADDAQVMLDGSSLPEVNAVEQALIDLRRVRDSSRTSPPSTPRPEPPPRAEVPPDAPAPGALRRARGLTIGLGASAGVLAVSLGVGVGAALTTRPQGPLFRRIEGEATAAGWNTASICGEVELRHESLQSVPASLVPPCDRFTEWRRVQTAMFVTSGVLAIASGVLVALLVEHRRNHGERREHTGRRGSRPKVSLIPEASGLRLAF